MEMLIWKTQFWGADIAGAIFKMFINLKQISGQPKAVDGLFLFYSDLMGAENGEIGKFLEENINVIQLGLDLTLQYHLLEKIEK